MGELARKHWTYDDIKAVAVRQPTTPTFINELKCMFVNDINSPRRYDCIRTVFDLIDCLERRDIISEQNIEPLRLFGNEQLNEVIENYVPPRRFTNGEDTNQYHELRIASEMARKLHINGNATMSGNVHHDNTQRSISANANIISNSTNPSNYAFALTDHKREAIYKVISQNLGTHWRSFGRELRIREGAMDEIEIQCPRELTTRIYKLLKIFEEDECHNPKMHLRIIRDALEHCRRKDIRRKVDDIMSH